jgi:hypothetical protein
MPLTEEEQKQLDALQRKAEEPDAPSSNRQDVVNITVDLSDEAAVKRALGLGLLRLSDVEGDDDDDDQDNDDDDDDDQDDGGKGKGGGRRRKPKPETPPKRGGYFGDK